MRTELLMLNDEPFEMEHADDQLPDPMQLFASTMDMTPVQAARLSYLMMSYHDLLDRPVLEG